MRIADPLGNVYDNVTFSNLSYVKASGTGYLACNYCYNSTTSGSGDDKETHYHFRNAYLAVPNDLNNTISSLTLTGDQVTLTPGSTVSIGTNYSLTPQSAGAISFTFSVDFVRSVT